MFILDLGYKHIRFGESQMKTKGDKDLYKQLKEQGVDDQSILKGIMKANFSITDIAKHMIGNIKLLADMINNMITSQLMKQKNAAKLSAAKKEQQEDQFKKNNGLKK